MFYLTETIAPIVAAFGLLALSVSAFAVRAQPPNAVAKSAPLKLARFDAAPVIDGKLEEEVWQQAVVMKDFVQTNPGDNTAPSHPTEVRIGYDAKFLYLAFIARDEPERVRATLATRDKIWEDDHVGVLLDTFNDQRRAYALYFNPFGVQADGTYTENSNPDDREDYSLDIVMESKGALMADGYIVEAAIPFKSLRYAAGDGKLWGIHVFRRVKRLNNELDSWMPLTRGRSGLLNQAGKLTGLIGIAVERNLEILPSITLSETGVRARGLTPSAPDRFVNRPPAFDPSLTMKLVLTPSVTLDFAVNPDFAQIEADQPVVTANQRFPIFFPERRPFFLEGLDFLQTELQPINTRAIVDPDVAVKLTGKRGRNAFAALLASDNAPGNFSADERNDPALQPEIAGLIGKNATIAAARWRRDVGQESNIGMTATSYNFANRRNQVIGVDGRLRLDRQSTFDFQVLGTSTRNDFYDPNEDKEIFRTGNGAGYFWRYDKTGRRLSYTAFGLGRTRDYRADVGFTRRTDTNLAVFNLRFFSEPVPARKIINWRYYHESYTNFDWRGRAQIWESKNFIELTLQRRTIIGTGFEFGRERLYEDEFGARRRPGQAGAFAGAAERRTPKHTYFLYGSTAPTNQFSMEIESAYRRGTFDLDFGAGPRYPRISPAVLADPNAALDPGAGDLLEVDAEVVYQPIVPLRLSLNYTHNSLRRGDTGRKAFRDDVYSTRATYQFTRFLFARARVDYSTLNARARGQFLFGWTPTPGTSFFIGYNEDVNRDGFNPFDERFEPGLRRNQRTFFIKMSYLFRRNL